MKFFDKRCCIYPGCENENIRSHAISKGLSLRSISEDSHLYCFKPRRNGKNSKKPSFEEVSIIKATRDYCFCIRHDNYFKELDDSEIRGMKGVLLQLYRSICVAYNQENNAVKALYGFRNGKSCINIRRESIEDYLKAINNESLIPHLDEPDVLASLERKIKFLLEESIDDRLHLIKKIIDKVKIIYNEIEDRPITLNETLGFNSKEAGFSVFVYQADFQIPVAMSAVHYPVVEGEITIAISIVVPYVDRTIIITLIQDPILESGSVVNRIDDFFSSKYMVIKYVESMMSCSDGWFIKPSILNSMTKDKREFFLNDCMFINERKIFSQYDLSIFDELKLKYTDKNPDAFLHIPTRPDYEERCENLRKAIGDSTHIETLIEYRD